MPAPVGPCTSGGEAASVAADGAPAGPSAAPDLRLVDGTGPLASSGRVIADPLTPLALSETERRFKFRGMPQAIGAARRALREWEAHFDPILFYDLSLCVSELVTNRVQHWDPGEGADIQLAVRRNKRLVRAEVSEPRPGAVLTVPPAMRASDWGMFIIDRVADRWGVDRDGGTLVWCELDLAGDGRSRAARERIRRGDSPDPPAAL